MIGGDGRHLLQAGHPTTGSARSDTGAAASARTPPSSNRLTWTRSGSTPRCGRCRALHAALRVNATSSSSSPAATAASAASCATARECPSVKGHLRSTKSPSATSSASSDGPSSLVSRSGACCSAVAHTSPVDGTASTPAGRRRTRRRPRDRTGRRGGCAPSPPHRRCRTRADAPRPCPLAWATRISIGICLARDALAGRPPPSKRSKVNRSAVCTSSARPIRSASRAADVQCEWMSCEIWPRALAYSVDDGLQPLTAATRRADVGQQEPLIRQPRPVDQIRAAAHRDVVAEPPRVLVRVGVTADPHDQRRVVDAVALCARQPSRSAIRVAISADRSMCSAGCPSPRSMATDSAARTSARVGRSGGAGRRSSADSALSSSAGSAG